MCYLCSLSALEGADIDLGSAPAFEAAYTDNPNAQGTTSSGEDLGIRVPFLPATATTPINGILWGTKWKLNTITYSFTQSWQNYQTNNPNDFNQYWLDENQNNVNALMENFTTLNSEQITAARFALDAQYGFGFSVEGFTNLQISPSPGFGGGTIRIANSDDAATAYGNFPVVIDQTTTWAQYFSQGDVFLGSAQDFNPQNSLKTPAAGNYAWVTMLHELGHALGLKHGHQQVPNNTVMLPSEWNTVEFSIMTYTTYVGGLSTGGYSFGWWDAPQTYMMLDIAALQHMYGADFTTNAGNTVYKWTPGNGDTVVNGKTQIDVGGSLNGSEGSNRIFMTVWDGNGIDTYDLSAYRTGVKIDLRPGRGSVFHRDQLADLGGGPNDGKARYNVYNAFQFKEDARSLIENAIGGSGNDNIVGNQANNALTGGAGNDTLSGLAGNDTLNGGAGADRMIGGAGNDIYYVDNAGDTVDESSGSGVDTVRASVTYSMLNTNQTKGSVENLVLLGSASINGSGNNLSNSITGNAGNNALYGYGGNDTISGGAGNDVIDGGTGSDNMIGGAGNDVYVVDSAGDIANETGGTGVDTVRSAVSFDLAGGQVRGSVENLVLQGSASIKGKGNALANVIVGNAGDNVLAGRGGNDKLQGGAGKDTLKGGGGNDTLEGGGGKDKLKGGGGNDTLKGGGGNDTLQGGGGKDKLIGGGGKDVLTGGGGKDIFVFKALKDSKPGKKHDVITDFGGKDKINLKKIDADKSKKGNQKFDFLGERSGFSGDEGQLRYEIKKKKTFVYGDVTGDGKADFMIELKGKIHLDASDFML